MPALLTAPPVPPVLPDDDDEPPEHAASATPAATSTELERATFTRSNLAPAHGPRAEAQASTAAKYYRVRGCHYGAGRIVPREMKSRRSRGPRCRARRRPPSPPDRYSINNDVR